jgi:hypothetical protein
VVRIIAIYTTSGGCVSIHANNIENHVGAAMFLLRLISTSFPPQGPAHKMCSTRMKLSHTPCKEASEIVGTTAKLICKAELEIG